jgi:hypothetical protein
MHSGRLKVSASLSKYLEERRLYRRKEKDQIVDNSTVEQKIQFCRK